MSVSWKPPVSYIYHNEIIRILNVDIKKVFITKKNTTKIKSNDKIDITKLNVLKKIEKA